MLSKLIIEQVIHSQKERLTLMDVGLPHAISDFTDLTTHALIVSGIRRCGKSILLQQVNKTFSGNSIYLPEKPDLPDQYSGPELKNKQIPVIAD